MNAPRKKAGRLSFAPRPGRARRSEVSGPEAALLELERLDGEKLAGFAPYHAVRADFLARVGRRSDARQAYATVLSLDPPPAEERWIRRKLGMLENERVRP